MKHGLIQAQKSLRASLYDPATEAKYRRVVKHLSADNAYVRIYGERLRKCRVSHQITMAELAKLIGVTEAGMSKIETGQHDKINVDYFFIFSNYLWAAPEYLLGFIDQPFPPNILDAKYTEDLPEDPSEILEFWQTKWRPLPEEDRKKTKPEARLQAQTMHLFDEDLASKVSYIIYSVWKDNVSLLYQLFLFANQTPEYCEKLCDALQLTFLPNCSDRSDNLSAADKYKCPDFRPSDDDVELLYHRIPSARKHARAYCLGRTASLSAEGMLAPLLFAFQDAFFDLFCNCPRLWNEYLKIAKLKTDEKQKVLTILNCFVLERDIC